MYSVLVIEESSSMRTIIKNIINNIDNFEVIDTANDAYEAREKIKKYEPDMVTVCIDMPKMDGFSFLKNLMRLHPMPAIVISKYEHTKDEISQYQVLGNIKKPTYGESMDLFSNNIKKLLNDIIHDLLVYKKRKPKSNIKHNSRKKEVIVELNEKRIEPDEILKSNPSAIKGSKIIGIGSSTGGVESLLKVFGSLPLGLPPIVITQHIPYGFSTSFANRLNEHSKVKVIEVSEDVQLNTGCAYLAPGNMHLVIEKDGSSYIGRLLDAKKVSRHKPSVDIMFRSINNSAGGGAMVIMMTGMGDDGKIAIKELYDNGAYTVAQNEESCVVFGMPQQAIKAGAIQDICHLNDISRYIIDFSKNKKG